MFLLHKTIFDDLSANRRVRRLFLLDYSDWLGEKLLLRIVYDLHEENAVQILYSSTEDLIWKRSFLKDYLRICWFASCPTQLVFHKNDKFWASAGCYPAAHDCQPIRQIKPDFERIDLNYSLDTLSRWQFGSLLGVRSPNCGLLWLTLC